MSGLARICGAEKVSTCWHKEGVLNAFKTDPSYFSSCLPRFLRRAASLSYYSPILAILSFPSFSSYTILHCKSSSSRVILLYFYLFHPPVPLSTKLLEFFDRNFRLRVTLSVSMFEVPGSPLAISVDFLRAVQSLLSLFSSL